MIISWIKLLKELINNKTRLSNFLLLNYFCSTYQILSLLKKTSKQIRSLIYYISFLLPIKKIFYYRLWFPFHLIHPLFVLIHKFRHKEFKRILGMPRKFDDPFSYECTRNLISLVRIIVVLDKSPDIISVEPSLFKILILDQ